jgi:hypothetical protein
VLGRQCVEPLRQSRKCLDCLFRLRPLACYVGSVLSFPHGEVGRLLFGGRLARGGFRSTSFKPGVSGNPSGRPKRPETIEARKIVADVKAAAQELTQEAIDTLKAVMKDPKAPPSARSAATAILDRGHGKPHQAAEVTQTVAMDVRTTRTLDVSHITDMAELAALERALNSTIARLEGTPFNSRERTI